MKYLTILLLSLTLLTAQAKSPEEVVTVVLNVLLSAVRVNVYSGIDGFFATYQLVTSKNKSKVIFLKFHFSSRQERPNIVNAQEKRTWS